MTVNLDATYAKGMQDYNTWFASMKDQQRLLMQQDDAQVRARLKQQEELQASKLVAVN